MKVKLTVPTSLSDIKLSQYQKFVRTTKDSKDDNFIARQIVGIFCGVSDEIVGSIRAKDFDSIVSGITEVLNEKPEFKSRFKLGGVEYGFIPKLEDITVGEKADLDSFLGDIDKMDKAMGVMYREVSIERSNGYDIEDYKADNESLDVTLDIAFGANVFFYNLMNDLLSYTQNFIAQEAERNPKVSQTLEQSGVGITAFINSLEVTFSSLRGLGNLNYMKH